MEIVLDLDLNNLPHHVAIIMDGNGRWAQARGLNRLEGHRAGVASVRRVIKNCRSLGINYLTLYTFSEENWNRPRTEVEGLMHLLNKNIRAELNNMHQEGIRVNILGDLKRLPGSSRKILRHAMDYTADNQSMVLSLALSYGGRQEILEACRHLARECLAGRQAPEDLDEKAFRAALFSPGLPDPDLLIRTGGEFRISNFLLWQIAYCEIYVTSLSWPDFDDQAFMEALRDFQRRQRRFGLTGQQLKEKMSR